MRCTCKLLMVFFALGFSFNGVAQGVYSAKQNNFFRMNVGVGIDYWDTDYSQRWKFGPTAWASTELWHGFGVLAEGRSLLAGGNLPGYKYWVGEGGVNYTVHRWHSVHPYAKGELGFASLDSPRSATYHSHDTRTTWAVGVGLEYHTWQRMWTRIDYTYDAFPGYLSLITLKEHTLNPNGLSAGISYHFR
jgi:opacity protein-like surface antigen